MGPSRGTQAIVLATKDEFRYGEATVTAEATATERRATPARRIGLMLGPALMVLTLLIPLPGLSPEAHRLAAIMLLVVVYWMTEAIPLAATALLGPVLCIVFGVADDRKVFGPFASPITFLFIGSFMLAEAMVKFGLDRRLALGLLSVRAFSRTPGRFFATLGLLTAGLSMWMSNTATTAMMLPIGLAAVQAWRVAGDGREARASLVLLIAFAASVGGQATPVGTPPNLIGLGAIREALGVRIGFLEWMMFGVPLAAIQLFFLLWLLRVRPETAHGAGGGSLGGDGLTLIRAEVGAWSRGEQLTVGIFALTVSLWLVPGLVDLIAGSENPVARFFRARLPEETVGLLAGVLLLVTPVSWRRGEFVLEWREAARIDWGTVLMFAGGMSLGKQLFDTGLAEALGRGVAGALGHPGVWTLTAAGIILSIAMSEAASNTASATMMVPTMIGVAQGTGVDPLPVALGTCLACSFGFLLPVSTGPNALAYGTGQVTIAQMMRRGFWLDVTGAVTIYAVVRLLVPVVGSSFR